jgi:hypothetical protein
MSQPNSAQDPDEQGLEGSGPEGGTTRIAGRKRGGIGGFLVGWGLSWAFVVVALINAYSLSSESFPTSWAVGAVLVLLAPSLFFLSPRRRTWFFIGLAAGSIIMGGMCLSLSTSNF